jgi:hypothetical protein
MNKNEILALTLAQFGILQREPIEESVLRTISLFARSGPDDSPEGVLWEEIAKEARTKGSNISKERRAELDEGFRKRLTAERNSLSSITVGDVINGWGAQRVEHAKIEDRSVRHFYRQTMNEFLIGLEYLDFPQEEVDLIRS